MLRERTVVEAALCVLVMAVAIVATAQQPQQVRHVLGSVHTLDDQAVTHTAVDYDGLSPEGLTDRGAFIYDLPPLKVGFPYTFHVAGWVILDPCVNARGNMYLPDPDAGKISLKVVRPGDPILLSAKYIGCIPEEKASRMEPKLKRGAGPESWLLPQGLPVPARRVAPETYGSRTGSIILVSLLEPLYGTNSSFLPAQEQSNGTTSNDEFLARQAKELGFTVAQLQAALSRWSAAVTDSYQKGLAALNAGRYVEACDYISKSLEGGGGPVERYVTLASAEYGRGKYPAAESALRRVAAAHEDDPLILSDLGVVLDAQGKFAEAEPFLKRALSLDEQLLGSDNPRVANDLLNLALHYNAQEKYKQAEPLYQRALDIDKKALGEQSPKVANDILNLALHYNDQEEYPQAEPLYLQALAIDEKALGPANPKVAVDLLNLALHYNDQEKYAQAEPFYQRALGIDEKALGPDNPEVAQDLKNMALLYDDEDKETEAEPLFRRALAIDEKALGPEHREVATDLNNLALVYDHEGKLPEAESLYQQALAIDEKVLFSGSTAPAPTLRQLAAEYEDEENYAAAETLLKRALVAAEKQSGPNGPEVAATAETLAAFLRKIGRGSEAKVYQDQAARIRVQTKQN